jgi:hypothetical protein
VAQGLQRRLVPACLDVLGSTEPRKSEATMHTPLSRQSGAGRELQQGLAAADVRPRASRWAGSIAIGLAVLFSVALAAPADAQWRGPDRRRPPVGYGGQYHPGYAQGYEDGYDKGREDARDRDRYDVRRHGRYRSADHGYDRRDGPRAQYRQVYRHGFEAGYDAGYRQWSQNRRGRGWPGRR